MPSRIEDIKQTLSNISRNKSLLDYLIEIERTLDELEVFTYANWEIGELVGGPHVQRHWVVTEWMYPDMKMPDPRGGLRIEKIGGKVSFKKDKFKKPSRVHDVMNDDGKQTLSAEMVEHDVWLVTIALPIEYVGSNPIQDQYDADAEDANDDIADAYSEPEATEVPDGSDDFAEIDDDLA